MTHQDAEVSTLGQNLTPATPAPVPEALQASKPGKPDEKPETTPDNRLAALKEAKASQTVRARVVSGPTVSVSEETEKRVRVVVAQILDAVQHRIHVTDLGDMEKAVFRADPVIVAAAMGDQSALAGQLEALHKARERMPVTFRREFDGIVLGAAEHEMRSRIKPLVESLAGEP